MELYVRDDVLTYSSNAVISWDTSIAQRIPANSYIRLSENAKTAPKQSRIFRVIVSTDVSVDGILIDYWPSASGDNAVIPTKVHAQVVPPACIRVAQFVELSPAGFDQPKLPLMMAKMLIKGHILHSSTGVLKFVYQGIEYGDWHFRVYYKGDFRRRKRHWKYGNVSADGGNSVLVDAGIVIDETMIMLNSFSESTNRGEFLLETPMQPIGVHSKHAHDLIKLALFPPTSKKAMHPQSIILYGSNGSGKSTLVQQLANEFEANLLKIDCTILATPSVHIEDYFTAAMRAQPALLVIENLELIFPRALDETKYKLICRFVSCLEKIHNIPTAQIAVVGIVTSLHSLNAKVHKTFQEEISLEIPDKTWSMRLLKSLLPSPNVLDDALLQSIAVRYGQTPSNIVAIARQLTTFHMDVLTNTMSTATQDTVQSVIDMCGRAISLKTCRTDGTMQSSVPNVRWDDIGGLADVKQALIEMVVWPLERPQVFTRMGISPPQGMLLYGPPGTGKTMLAKAAACASGCNFLNVLASDLMKAEFGESEKAITRVFDTARALSPCMIFIDEFQSLFGNRATAGVTTSRMISQLLIEMDMHKAAALNEENDPVVESDRVYVLAATNALTAIDPAFLQPGRFENVLYVGLPNEVERRAILALQRTKMPWNENVDISALAQRTDGVNAAALVALCQSAAIKAMQRSSNVKKDMIDMADFLEVLESQ